MLIFMLLYIYYVLCFWYLTQKYEQYFSFESETIIIFVWWLLATMLTYVYLFNLFVLWR